MRNRNGRRYEIVRRILSELYKSDEPKQLAKSQFLDYPDIDTDTLDEYIERLLELGMIEIEGNNTYQLTWEGEDFLGFSNDNVIWQAAKQVAGDLSFHCFHSILKDLMLWKARKVAEEFFQKAERKQK